MADIDNLKGGTKRTVDEESLDNLRGGTKRTIQVNSIDNSKGGVKRVYVVGGGGGSVDYAKTVQRAETMPTADSSNAGQQFLYAGETDANYTHDYIYENVATTVAGSATASQTTGSSLSDIAVDVETFEEELDEYDIPKETGNYVFTYDGADWYLNGTVYDPADFGVTFTGTPVADDVITVAYTAATTTYSWTRVDVQPAPEALPDQTGQSGKFLTTDGTDASWSDKPLVNTATATSALTILGTANTTQANAINIGGASVVAGSADIAIGNKAKTYSDGVQIAIGYEAEVKNNSGISIGAGAKSLVTNGASTAIGAYARVLATGKCGLVLGNYGQVSAPYAIEINATDFTYTNSEEGTLCVGLRKGSSGANYKLMDSDGTVPTARLTKVNTTATLAVADWSSNTQTVTVSGVKADSVVFVSPAPASASDYASAGILCTAQVADSLTFTCTTTPSNAITVNVVCL